MLQLFDKPFFYGLLLGLIMPVAFLVKVFVRLIQGQPLDYPLGDYVVTFTVALVMFAAGYYANKFYLRRER